MAKLKVAGTWAGVVEVELEQWTVPMLRAEVARRSNARPESINLISAGRVLRDGDGTESLSQLGIKNNSKILSSRVNVDQKQELLAEEERSNRLARIKSVPLFIRFFFPRNSYFPFVLLSPVVPSFRLAGIAFVGLTVGRNCFFFSSLVAA